jgi:two-component system nitrate/nitrite response regulator NarL
MAISVFFVDDHRLILDAWTKLLERFDHIKICGTASTRIEAFHAIHESRPDVVLMDINLKNESGLDLTGEITKTLPKTRIIGLSMHDDMVFVKQMLKNGASGYLTKNVDITELVTAIEVVHSGNIYVCREIKDREFFQGLTGSEENNNITSKELEVIQLVIKGHTSKEIGETLNVAKRTIDTHRYNIMKKLNVANISQLIDWAKNKGIG